MPSKLPHYFNGGSEIFTGGDCETKAKTNSGRRMRPLLVESPLLVCTEYAQSPLFARYIHTHTQN